MSQPKENDFDFFLKELQNKNKIIDKKPAVVPRAPLNQDQEEEKKVDLKKFYRREEETPTKYSNKSRENDIE